MASATFLSTNDNAVLGALFDPEAALNNRNQISDAILDSSETARLQSIQSQEKEALLPLNSEKPAEHDILAALAKLDAIIESNPTYPSAWNNRAQTRRMLFEVSQLPSHPDELKSILGDLAEAVRLATPASPSAPVSSFDARVLASAHSHRGYLLWTASRSDEMANAVICGLDIFKGLDRGRLEEMASHEFSLGGRYGNDTARQLAVRTNPYAKLCGSIVQEALRKEIQPVKAENRCLSFSIY